MCERPDNLARFLRDYVNDPAPARPLSEHFAIEVDARVDDAIRQLQLARSGDLDMGQAISDAHGNLEVALSFLDAAA